MLAMPRLVALLGFSVALVALSGCAHDGDSADTGDDQNVTAAPGGAVSSFECTVGKGVDSVDNAAKLSFKIKGLGAPKATFVDGAGKVLDKAGGVLHSDGAHSSVVAEGFENGGDLQQCRKDPTKGVVCGSFVLGLDNSSSEMPVTITLTKMSDYKKGTLTIDNTINTGDNSGFLHAPLDCTIDGK
jgi:hypothetical protein